MMTWQVELMEDGAATDVTYASRGRFADLTIAARLNEGAAQCDALMAGIASVVPSTRLLSLLTGKQLEQLTVGEADVDVATLRAHTSYGATAAAGMAHVRYFWATLEAFTPEQRRLFLKARHAPLPNAAPIAHACTHALPPTHTCTRARRTHARWK